MLKLLLVNGEKDSLRGLSSALSGRDNIEWETVASGHEALEILSDKPVDLVIADEYLGDMTALEFSKRLLEINAMINCAVVSSLSPEEFHEASEGLGLLAQLPGQPGAKEAESLIATLERIRGLLN